MRRCATSRCAVANVLSEDDEMLLSITEQRSGQPSVIR